jgi:protein TonB
MAFFGILTVVVALHILLLVEMNFKDEAREQPSQSAIEVSLITKSLPTKTKQNDNVIAESQPLLPQPRIEPIKPFEKPIEKRRIIKPIEQKVIPKKETLKPQPKVVTTEKSEITIEKAVKPTKIKAEKKETPKKIEELPKEKPRLSLETIQQQISQIGSEVHQQVNVRDKYISEFSSKVKRIGQTIYDKGTLPAGILETKIELNSNGTINNFKITRSSGSAKLDEAVANMIRSSAPYPDLPFQLLNESSTLTFTRVWEFYGD